MTIVLPEQYIAQPTGLFDLAERAQRNFDALALEAASSRAGAATSVIAFLNGWAATAGYQAPTAYKYGPMVTIVAAMDGSAAVATHAFTLPVGFRPAAKVGAPLNYWTGATRGIGTITINNSGGAELLGNGDVLQARIAYFINLTFAVA